MTIQVEKNIPIPQRARGGGKRKYPLDIMEVGDSFFLGGVKQNFVAGSVSYASRKYGFKFVTRTEGDGARVWRIA